jgi:hypothetical protein
MFKKNNFKFGAVLALLAPVLSLVIFYFIKFYPLFSVEDFFQYLSQDKKQITGITVPCLVLNIALFTYYINSRRDHTAKGIFLVTLIYAIGALLLKFIL